MNQFLSVVVAKLPVFCWIEMNMRDEGLQSTECNRASKISYHYNMCVGVSMEEMCD